MIRILFEFSYYASLENYYYSGSMWGMRVSGGSAFSINNFHFNQVKLVGENNHTITLTSCNNSFQDYNISDYENYLYTENTTSITGLYREHYFYLFASRLFTLNVYRDFLVYS